MTKMIAWRLSITGLLAVVLVLLPRIVAGGRCRQAGAIDGSQISFGPVAELGPQLSPDGQSIAFEYFPKDRPNLPQIWVMDRAEGFKSARPLVDNRNYNAEFSWSPDGNWICFISNSLTERPITNQIYKVRVSDGAVRQITNFDKGKALGDSTSWSKDDLIAFENERDIYTVSASDGSVRKLVVVGSQMLSLTPSEIRWSPDNSRLAFTGKEEQRGSEKSRIWVADAKNRKSFPVTDSRWDSTPSWYDNDHVLFSRGQSEEETKVCLLTLATGRIECLTKGNIDLSPWGEARAREIFFARGTRSSSDKNSAAFFAGFHIWRSRIVN